MDGEAKIVTFVPSDAPVVDQEMIDFIKSILSDAEAGKITSLSCVYTCDKEYMRFMRGTFFPKKNKYSTYLAFSAYVRKELKRIDDHIDDLFGE